ncbi:MAG TPA: radical SAM protein [Candidatus Glassbacteria bacterium]|jgi:hypothetical protein|nr:radical SAM protein [Candidatus Glassbacteria bacterium]
MLKYKSTKWPTMEITTCVPAKGCIVDCVFCPQRLLEKKYTGTRYLRLDGFKFLLDKIPEEVRITFAGFVEPWLNKECTDMLLYANEKGHQISVFTTGIGMSPDDVERIKDVPYAGMPNGGFALHLPDNERLAKHPITDKYLKVLEKFREYAFSIKHFYLMSMGEEVHESIAHIFQSSELDVPVMWHRAGNLLGEAILKPELMNYKDRFHSIFHGEEPRTCNCVERLYHNVLMPNGDVSLCCMDYNLENIIGNLYRQDYNEVLPKPLSCFDICRRCENGVTPQSLIHEQDHC